MLMNDKLYRIYCEDVNRDVIDSILAYHFTGYTILSAAGSYGGIPEDSLIIEVFDTTLPTVIEVCGEIAEKCNQEQVVYTVSPCYIGTVYGTPKVVTQ